MSHIDSIARLLQYRMAESGEHAPNSIRRHMSMPTVGTHPTIVLNGSSVVNNTNRSLTPTSVFQQNKRKFEEVESNNMDYKRPRVDDTHLQLPQINVKRRSPYPYSVNLSPHTENKVLNLVANSVRDGDMSPNSIYQNIQHQLERASLSGQSGDACIISDEERSPDKIDATQPTKKDLSASNGSISNDYKYLVNMGRRPRKNKKVEPEDKFVTKFSLRS
ncbi:developmentally-regulated protein [Acrasis kona]|uniref:Developmentally-regulated protein n=1 Tax=Acrasis kona TaxID=1008807 RepID=A0AAW2YTK4_9EUKA